MRLLSQGLPQYVVAEAKIDCSPTFQGRGRNGGLNYRRVATLERVQSSLTRRDLVGLNPGVETPG
jgi:hypothetical protein